MREEQATRLRVHPIPATTLRRLRAQGHDDQGNAWHVRTGEPGHQLRCCLRHSEASDRVVLIAHAPLAGRATGPDGPYDEVGPVFVHAEECDGYREDAGIPTGWFSSPRVLRAYNRRGGIHGGALVRPGDDPAAVARELLADPEVAFLHARNVAQGCYMFEIRPLA